MENGCLPGWIFVGCLCVYCLQIKMMDNNLEDIFRVKYVEYTKIKLYQWN